ncbi:MAG: ferritin-like domain-containing protein [Acetobacteraceae bacterium]
MKQTIAILQTVLATEIVCVLRYTLHSIAATGISSEGVKAEFAEHAGEEQKHMNAVAERINQLGLRRSTSVRPPLRRLLPPLSGACRGEG